jgi:hypothetical protein
MKSGKSWKSVEPHEDRSGMIARHGHVGQRGKLGRIADWARYEHEVRRLIKSTAAYVRVRELMVGRGEDGQVQRPGELVGVIS